MNKDLYNRKIDYLRLGVTNVCNFRCSFCSPENYNCYLEKDELGDEQIINIINAAADLGFKKIRLTGGEPLLRKNLIALIKKIDRKLELALTTNGSLLEEHAHELIQAGIKRININLPSLNKERHERITGSKLLEQVKKGINTAKNLGAEIKINVVAISDLSEEEMIAFNVYCLTNNFKLRFIEAMPIGTDPLSSPLSIETLKEYLRKNNIKAEIISFSDMPQCGSCNRLRISANGEIFPCLFSAPLNTVGSAKNKSEIREILKLAICEKPATYKEAFTDETRRTTIRTIGG